MRSRPLRPWPSTVNSGRVSPIIHEIVKSSPMRMPSASVSPSRRAASCRLAGSRPVRIAMKTTLSTPRTISSAASVASATRPSAVRNASIVGGILPQRPSVYCGAVRSVTLVLTLLLGAPLLAAGARAPEDVVAEVRRATARYADVATARADGYLQASGMEARHGYHFVQPATQARALATGTLDLAAPPVLLYVERDGLWQLVGVEYALPSVPRDDALPGAAWHTHEASCHYRDFRELPAPSASARSSAIPSCCSTSCSRSCRSRSASSRRCAARRCCRGGGWPACWGCWPSPAARRSSSTSTKAACTSTRSTCSTC